MRGNESASDPADHAFNHSLRVTELFRANAEAAAKNASIPVALHLDHGSSNRLAEDALAAGYTSIMIDGSHFPLKENIVFTKKTADLCAKAGVPVEGELGRVGGKEDDLSADSAGYTSPAEAVRFVKETGIFSLAIGVGTAHGVYASRPVLRPDLISILKKELGIPLVLHGASGLDIAVIRDCIARGICKVNIATDFRIAYTRAVREYLANDPECIDPKKFGEAGREAVRKIAVERILICGCQGKANEE